MTIAIPHLRRRWLLAALAAIAAALLLLALVGPEPAYAAAASSGKSAEEAGKNVGDIIRGIMKPIVYAVGAIGGVGAIFRRDFSTALTLLALTIIISVFVLQDGQEALQGLGRLFSDALNVR